MRGRVEVLVLEDTHSELCASSGRTTWWAIAAKCSREWCGAGGAERDGVETVQYCKGGGKARRSHTLRRIYVAENVEGKRQGAPRSPPPPYFILCEALNHTAPDEKEAFR